MWGRRTRLQRQLRCFALAADDALVISAVADPSVADEDQCDVDMVYDRCSLDTGERGWTGEVPFLGGRSSE